MFTDIHLLNVPELDVQHNHTFSFANKEQQLNYFLSKKVKTIENVNYHRKNNNLKVNYHIDELQFVNYIMINNETPLNKWYYYFVIDRTYINEHCTELILKLDVMQTYLFDYTFKSSLVERQHYNRYTSDGTVVNAYFKQPIDYNTGEYIVNFSSTIYDYANDGCYIITSSEPLGRGANLPTSGSGSNTKPNYGLHGNLSANIFRYIKGWEAYWSVAYQDSGGVWTIGYGVTQNSHPEAYSDLVANCTEEKASNYLYEIAKNSYYMPIAEEIITKRIGSKQNEIDAFVDLAYNCGVYGCTSSPMYQAYISNKPLNECVNGWNSYYIRDALGNELQGLINRRNDEVNIFLNANYNYRTITSNYGTVTDNDGNGYIPYNLRWIENFNGNDVSTDYSRAVTSARKLIGKPYVYGGNYPPLGSHNGTDCSGLCEWAYQDAAISTGLSHRWTTYTMYPYTKEISLSEAKAGDVLYSSFSGGLPTHVRIIVNVIGDTVYWVGAENEDIGIIESSSIFNSNFKIGTFRGV